MEYSINEPKVNREGSIEIIGEKGSIKAGGAYLNEWEYSTDDSSLKNKIDLLQHEFFLTLIQVKRLYPIYISHLSYLTIMEIYQGSMRNHHCVYDSSGTIAAASGSLLYQYSRSKNTIELINLIYQAR